MLAAFASLPQDEKSAVVHFPGYLLSRCEKKEAATAAGLLLGCTRCISFSFF